MATRKEMEYHYSIVVERWAPKYVVELLVELQEKVNALKDKLRK